MTISPSITDARETLLAFAKRIATGPLSLHHALLAGIAALDAGSYGHLALEHRRTLDAHTGGWFGKAAEVRELLEALDAYGPARPTSHAPRGMQCTEDGWICDGEHPTPECLSSQCYRRAPATPTALSDDEARKAFFQRAADLAKQSAGDVADHAIEAAAKLIEELQLDREGATSVSGRELRDILRGLVSCQPSRHSASLNEGSKTAPPSMKKPDYGKWICLDWYDGPLSEIALVTYNDTHKLAEIKCQGGWVGEDYRVGQNSEKFYVNHMRFDRETLVAMLDLIDGKPVKDFHED